MRYDFILTSFSNRRAIFHYSSLFQVILKDVLKWYLLLYWLLTLLILLFSFSSQALTANTIEVIKGDAPYLTFDGGHTRATDTDSLLGIYLSNGDKYTPSANTSSLTNPIELPNAGQSFADIGMLMPIDTDSIELNSLIGAPYHYWGDDDGDGANGITATGNLSLSIVDKNNQAVSRNTVLTICNAPYKVTLNTDGGILSTRYGVPNSNSFNEGNATYYINPKAGPSICFIRPSIWYGKNDYAGPASIWAPDKGFLPQSFVPSKYGQNFPTTGADGLYFDLVIGGSNQALHWAPVSSHDGRITAIMTPDASGSIVRVLLRGPAASSLQIKSLDESGDIEKLTPLPQVFELVGKGKDSDNNDIVVKYGFELKQWFINMGHAGYIYNTALQLCNSPGYRMVKVKDLTNAVVHQGSTVISGTSSSSSFNHYQRQIGAGFFSEWGYLHYSADISFFYWANDNNGGTYFFVVDSQHGYILGPGFSPDVGLNGVMCTYP